MIKFLKQIIVPTCVTAILSCSLVLAWYLYDTAYRPLIETDTTTIITASDYALAGAKLTATLQQLDSKATTPVDITNVPNPFRPNELE